jgi:hypothetical protein
MQWKTAVAGRFAGRPVAHHGGLQGFDSPSCGRARAASTLASRHATGGGQNVRRALDVPEAGRSLPMNAGPRRTALRVVRRFLHGQANEIELEPALLDLGLSETMDTFVPRRLSASDAHWIECGPRDVLRQIHRTLQGKLDAQGFHRWISRVRTLITSPGYEAVCGTSAPLVGTLGVLTLLWGERLPLRHRRSRRSLVRVLHWLEAGQAAPARTFLSRVFRDLRCASLTVLENPLAFGSSAHEQWLDVGLLSSAWGSALAHTSPGSYAEETLTMIPFSVFTKRFFQEELPRILAGPGGPRAESARDPFVYHPENDRAVTLKENARGRDLGRFDFQYFIDHGGLAEIVIDSPSIRCSEIVFASRLFCLQNNIRSATLDGVQITALTDA